MRAWIIPSFGSIDTLAMTDVPDPTPASGEVVLRVKFAALNPADRYLAEGGYPARPPLPHILGRDGLGVVESVGTGVTGLKPGDTRMILRGDVGVERAGTFAAQVAAPAELLVPIPDGWTEHEAACGSLVYLTAWQALTQWGEISPGVVMVSGASGGVGVATIQLARALGHRVVALSRGTKKVDRLLQLGASIVVSPETSGWTREVLRQIKPARVDIMVDNIGGKNLAEALEVMGDHGRVSLVGRLAGPVPEFNTARMFFRRLRMGGVAAGSYSAAEARDAWNSALALLKKTGAKPLVDSVIPFDRLPEAFNRLAAGPMGKVLLAGPE